jgi:hypothetical protein
LVGFTYFAGKVETQTGSRIFRGKEGLEKVGLLFGRKAFPDINDI